MPDGKYFSAAVSIQRFGRRLTDGGRGHEVHVADLRRGTILGKAARGRAETDLRGVRPAGQVGRTVRDWRAVAADCGGDQRARAQREATLDRWSVCGNTRAARRLLPGRGKESGRGDLARRKDSLSEVRHD